MTRTAITFAAVLLSGGAAAYSPAHIYNQVRVVNHSDATVSDLTLVHKPSGRSYRCDQIKPLQVCAHYFGKRRFDPGPFEVTWRFDGGDERRKVLEVAVPAYFPIGIAIQGIVDIDADGDASFRNEQYTPQ